MASTLNCIVATPTRELFQGQVSYVEVPSVDGSYGVLPGHEMIVSLNRDGSVCTVKDESGNKEQFFLVEGAAQVLNDVVTVFGRFGKNVKDINKEAAIKRATELKEHIAELEEKPEDPQTKAELFISKEHLGWHEAQVKYAEDNNL